MDTGGDDGEDREEDEEDELDEGEEAEDEENIGAAEEDDDKEEKDRPGVLVVFIGSKLSRVTELWLCAKPDTWRLHRILKQKYTDIFTFHGRRGQRNDRISNLLKKYYIIFLSCSLAPPPNYASVS